MSMQAFLVDDQYLKITVIPCFPTLKILMYYWKRFSIIMGKFVLFMSKFPLGCEEG